jgi:mRNA interferase RelE/StbE
MYQIIVSNKAKKQLKKLECDIRKRIITTIKRCKIRPYSHVKRLVGCSYYRLRIGDYRVIMNIQDNKLRILVIEIDHRKNIYKK